MADQPMTFVPAIPTQDERTMAFVAHLLQIFTGFIGPLIIFCVKQDSRFVKFHALQCLLWQLCYMVCFFIGGIVFFLTIVGRSRKQPAITVRFQACCWLPFRSFGFWQRAAVSRISCLASFTALKRIAGNGRPIRSLAPGSLRNTDQPRLILLRANHTAKCAVRFDVTLPHFE